MSLLSASRVSVLIVNCRVYEELNQALSCIEPYLRPADEIVVFDQESDRVRLDALAADHPRARFIPCAANIGFAAGVNRCAAKATAPYLLLLNPDTLVETPIVEALAGWLDAHPRTGIVGPKVINEDGSVQASARRFPGPSAAVAGRSTWLSKHFPDNWLTRRNLLSREAHGPLTVDWLAGSCLMVRRDLFDRLGGFDESFFLYWEDADLARRARARGFVSTYLPVVSVRHLGGRSSARDPGPAIRAFHRSAYRLYWKHSGPIGRLAAPAVLAALWVRGELRARRAIRRLRQRTSDLP